MPEGAAEGILKGIYKFKAAANGETKAKSKNKLQLFGSGPMLPEAVKAQAILAEKYNVAADVWSVTSYNELRREALKVERWNRLHPAEEAKKPLHSADAGRRGGTDRRCVGLHEDCAGPDCALACRDAW